MDRRRIIAIVTAGLIGCGGLSVAGAEPGSHTAAPAYLVHEVSQPHGQANDNFGESMAVSAATLVVGAPGVHSYVGAAYVYQRPATGWAHARRVATLVAGTGSAPDEFGWGVAISTRLIAVAAPFHQVGTTESQGVVYLFVEPKAGWSGTLHPSATLEVSDGAEADQLGEASVAISGRTVVAGSAYRQVGSNPSQGAVYLWTEPKGGWSGTRDSTAELTATDGQTNDAMGYGVGVDGDVVVAGSGQHQVGGNAVQGEVYVWVKPASGWAGWSSALPESATLRLKSGAVSDDLGDDIVGVSGRTVVAGAGGRQVGSNADQGAVYVFDEPKAGWSGTVYQSAELTASNGRAADRLGLEGTTISGDRIAAPAIYREVRFASQGAVYVFDKPKHGWRGTIHQSAELTAPDGGTSDLLGADSLAMFGTSVVAGAPNHTAGDNSRQGAAYVFAPGRPTVSSLKASVHSVRAAPRTIRLNPAHPPKQGVRFSFTLNQAASLAIAFVKHGRHKPAGTLTLAAPSGRNRLYFFGALAHHHKLPAGRYAVRFVASSTAGRSVARVLHLTITRR